MNVRRRNRRVGRRNTQLVQVGDVPCGILAIDARALIGIDSEQTDIASRGS